MENREKLATLGKQDEDKHNKKHNIICVGHHFTQTNTNNVNKTFNVLHLAITIIKPHLLIFYCFCRHQAGKVHMILTQKGRNRC